MKTLEDTRPIRAIIGHNGAVNFSVGIPSGSVNITRIIPYEEPGGEGWKLAFAVYGGSANVDRIICRVIGGEVMVLYD